MKKLIRLPLLLTSLAIGLSIHTIALAQNLDGKAWKLVRWGSTNQLESPLEGTEITAEFTGDKIAGSGGCNRYTASYEINSNTISFGPAAATKMACPEKIMDQENQYFLALDGAKEYKINNQGQLEITYETAQGEGVMVFAPQSVRALW